MAPHQERVVKEKTELDEKLGKLAEFLMTELFRSLPGDEQVRLRRQHAVMAEYSDILRQRIEAFPAA